MKQSDLIKLIANDTGITYETVRKIIRKTTKYIAVAIENNDSVHLGVGTFDTKLRREKPVHNFKTGERYMLPPAHKILFKPSNYLKGILKKKDSLEKLDSVLVSIDNGPSDEEE
jgi:nucleoid DNA-binding protein